MILKRSLLASTCIALVAPAGLGAGAAFAQGFAIDEITVTARQREETLQDVPATVTVLTETTLRRAGVERAEDFIALTPGVTFVDTAEVGDTQVNIRGINGSRDAENSFAFVLDGVLLTNPSSFNREFGDLQQIEVLKGPQGAIYGRNAAAGAIIVTTKKPGNEVEGQIKASVANEDSYFVSGYVSGPIVEDQLYAQISGDWRDTDGFYTNSFLNDDVVDNFENYNIKGRVVWEPTDALSIDSKVRYGEVDAASIGFNAVFALPELSGLLGVPELFEDANDHEFVFQPNIRPTNEQETFEASIKADWETEFGTLTTWFLYSDIDQNFLADGTSGAFGFFNQEPSCRASIAELTGTVALPSPQFFAGTPEASFLGPYTPSTCDGYQFQVRNQEDFSVEVRFASPADQRLRWLVGGYYLNLERQVGVASLVDDGTAPIASLINERTDQLVFDEFNTDVFAGFGQLALDVTPEIELSAALRYDREEREVTNLVPTDQTSLFIDFDPVDGDGDGNPFNDGGSPLNPGLNPLINPTGVIPDASETFDQIQPKISATWDVTPEVTLFANWGIGFKSGGFNNQGSAATIDFFINNVATGANVQIEDVFDEETSSAFEAGFKGSFLDGRLQLEGAGFYTDVDDMQFFEFFVGSFGLLRVVNNIDEVEIIGGELAANFAVTDNLSVYAGGAIIESEIKRNDSRPDTVGNESPYTADYTINLGAEFVQPVAGGDFDFVARGDWSYVGPTWFHTVQDETRPTVFEPAFGPVLSQADFSRTERDAYGILNLRAGIEGEKFGAYLFARNALNKQFLEEVIPAPEFGGAFVNPSALRLFGAELTVKY